MILKLTMDCMLEMSFPSFISQRPCEIPIFRTFLAKVSDFGHALYCLLKIGYFDTFHLIKQTQSYAHYDIDSINYTLFTKTRKTLSKRLVNEYYYYIIVLNCIMSQNIAWSLI